MKLKKRFPVFMLVSIMILSFFLNFSTAENEETAKAPEDEITLTILGTSDLHGNILGFSYEDNAETSNNGMARLYTYISQVRAENPNTILIDNGDAIQGTIMTDDLFNPHPEKEHPMMTVMNAFDYDCMTLGNHEFNWGVPTMLSILSQAEFPVLAANVLNADGERITGSGWTIVERGGIKAAVIGVVTPAVPIWDAGKEGVEECTYEAASEAVKAAIAEIGDQADLIIVSAHMGMYAEFFEEDGADSARKILNDNPEIDILLSGHMHITLNETHGNTLVGAPRNGGRDIVRFDITFDADKKIIDASVEVIDMKDYEPSAEVSAIPGILNAHTDTIQYITGGGSDGESKGAVLGYSTAPFQPEDEIKGIPSGRLMDTAVMDLINRVQLEYSNADVSASALFKNTSDLPKGEICYSNIFDIYKFDNTLYRVKVTGAELKAYMEWTAGYYNQWVPGDINISFDPEFPDYLYDVFAGVDYEIDISRPKGQRIKNVMFKGEPLKDDQILTLAVNNYRYSSALKQYGLVAATKEWESPCSVRDMIVEYLAENSPISPETDNNWKIVGIDLEKDNPLRAEIIQKINAGEIAVPYHESINIRDYE